MRTVSNEAMNSRELTFTKKQKRYWRESMAELVCGLNIGVSEIIDFNTNNSSVEKCSLVRSEAAYTSSGDTRSDNESLKARSVVKGPFFVSEA